MAPGHVVWHVLVSLVCVFLFVFIVFLLTTILFRYSMTRTTTTTTSNRRLRQRTDNKRTTSNRWLRQRRVVATKDGRWHQDTSFDVSWCLWYVFLFVYIVFLLTILFRYSMTMTTTTSNRWLWQRRVVATKDGRWHQDTSNDVSWCLWYVFLFVYIVFLLTLFYLGTRWRRLRLRATSGDNKDGRWQQKMGGDDQRRAVTSVDARTRRLMCPGV
jgi:uncharacterized membrane protein